MAENYGTDSCQFDEKALIKWREELCRLWGVDPPGVRLREKGAYKSPVYHELLKARACKAGGPDIFVPTWLEKGAPLGIE